MASASQAAYASARAVTSKASSRVCTGAMSELVRQTASSCSSTSSWSTSTDGCGLTQVLSLIGAIPRKRSWLRTRSRRLRSAIGVSTRTCHTPSQAADVR